MKESNKEEERRRIIQDIMISFPFFLSCMLITTVKLKKTREFKEQNIDKDERVICLEKRLEKRMELNQKRKKYLEAIEEALAKDIELEEKDKICYRALTGF